MIAMNRKHWMGDVEIWIFIIDHRCPKRNTQSWQCRYITNKVQHFLYLYYGRWVPTLGATLDMDKTSTLAIGIITHYYSKLENIEYTASYLQWLKFIDWSLRNSIWQGRSPIQYFRNRCIVWCNVFCDGLLSWNKSPPRRMKST